jgi:hypothetical protein
MRGKTVEVEIRQLKMKKSVFLFELYDRTKYLMNTTLTINLKFLEKFIASRASFNEWVVNYKRALRACSCLSLQLRLKRG